MNGSAASIIADALACPAWTWTSSSIHAADLIVSFSRSIDGRAGPPRAISIENVSASSSTAGDRPGSRFMRVRNTPIDACSPRPSDRPIVIGCRHAATAGPAGVVCNARASELPATNRWASASRNGGSSARSRRASASTDATSAQRLQATITSQGPTVIAGLPIVNPASATSVVTPRAGLLPAAAITLDESLATVAPGAVTAGPTRPSTVARWGRRRRWRPPRSVACPRGGRRARSRRTLR